jgi:hypothetical protein
VVDAKLGETLFSQDPVRVWRFYHKSCGGAYIVGNHCFHSTRVNVDGVQNGFRNAAVKCFKKNNSVWDVRAKLCTNLCRYPAAHRPLGGIMCARRAVYEIAPKFRAEKNGRLIEKSRETVSFTDSEETEVTPYKRRAN